jgi:hypothetical protein
MQQVITKLISADSRYNFAFREEAAPEDFSAILLLVTIERAILHPRIRLNMI